MKFEELLEQYRKMAEKRDEAIGMIEELKLQIKKRRTAIASEVLSAIDANGRKIYSNDMLRSAEIEKRAFQDEQISRWQENIWKLEREKREAEREIQILYWQIEGRVHSPQVV